MKKRIVIILLSFMILPSIISASSGALKTDSVKKCPDGNYYGSHGDGHWHKAVLEGKLYYPDGDAIETDPCKKVKLSFNPNGGSVDKKSKTVYENYPYETLPTPSRKGYKFNGWYTSLEDGELIESNSIVSSKIKTLYARWSKIKYTITYELYGGTNNKDNPTSYKVTSKIEFKKPTKKGYIFKGWYKDKDFKKEISEIKKGTTGNKTLYAKWKAIRYTIKFNSNGGKGYMKNSPLLKYSANYTLPKNKYTRKGYKFVEWNTKKDGTGKSFDNKETIKKLTHKNNKTVVLYARWSKIKYNIKYELNGGINNDNNPISYKVTDTIKLIKPTRKGYEFKGWYLDSKYKTKITTIEKGTTGNKTLYAKWKKITYTISYKLNEGKNNNKNVFTYNVKSEVILYEPTRKNYIFKGWYIDKNFEHKIDKIEKGTTGNKTLYAKWKYYINSITYELNGGINNENNVSSFTKDDEVILYEPVREGYIFNGWYIDSSFENKITKIEKETTDDIKLYAKWNPIEYFIIYNLDDGTNNSNNPIKYTVEDEVILYEPTKGRYTFDGWYIDGSFEQKIDKIEKGTMGNIALYAKWGDIRNTITYELDGGINNEKNVNYFKSDEEVELFNPSKNGYDFDGWYDNTDFTNKITKIVEGTTEDITVYAKWNIKNYAIDYHLNGGTNNSNNVNSYTINDNITLYEPTKSGFDFDGWRLDGIVGERIDEISVGSTGTKHLYAKWNPRTYNIYYVLNGGTNSSNNPDTFNSNESVFLHTPFREGFLFGGWYTDQEFTNSITEIPFETDHDVTVYARWDNPASYEDALSKALEYLSKRGYSYERLKFILHDMDGFDEEAATYAVDNCDANWSEQAIRVAKQLENAWPYSPKNLENNLINYEIFSKEEANYAVLNADINWEDVAARFAFNANQNNTFTYDELVEYMIEDGFSEELAIHGANYIFN